MDIDPGIAPGREPLEGTVKSTGPLSVLHGSNGANGTKQTAKNMSTSGASDPPMTVASLDTPLSELLSSKNSTCGAERTTAKPVDRNTPSPDEVPVAPAASATVLKAVCDEAKAQISLGGSPKAAKHTAEAPSAAGTAQGAHNHLSSAPEKGQPGPAHPSKAQKPAVPRFKAGGGGAEGTGAENGAKAPSGTNDTSTTSSLHPTSSDSLEKVAMHERITVGEEATGGGDAEEGVAAACDAEVDPDDSGGSGGDAQGKSLAGKLAVDPLSAPSSDQGGLTALAAIAGGGERSLTGIMKTCSLCGGTKDTSDFGPKKGSRDGKDCYCRICSTLRRRYSIPVVRAAVENGTLHQLVTTGKPRTSFGAVELRSPSKTPTPAGQASSMPPLGNPPLGQPAATGGAAAGALTASNGTAADTKPVPCVLCSMVKSKDEIAIVVAGGAFCVPCDRLRRRANNLGLGTKDVIDANRSGSLAGFLGMTAEELAHEMGKASAAEPVAAVVAVKAPTGRICRMCRQVRAPVVDGQRLSYCEDCEVVKGRAQGRGFTVSQLQDAFEANTFRALFGDMYNYIAAGTRFDYSRSEGGGVGGAGADDTVPGMAPAQGGGAGAGKAAVPEALEPLATRKRKRQHIDAADAVEEGGEHDAECAAAAAGQGGGAPKQERTVTHGGHARGAAKDGDETSKRAPLPMMSKGGKQELLRRCALCKAIRPLSEFPLDGKRSHGRACYCHPCKRLRGRAQSVSKSYDTAWLRAALESNSLRERLGGAAESVLSIIQPDKPVTACLSPDAEVEWAGDNPMVWRAAVVRAQRAAPPSGSGGAAQTQYARDTPEQPPGPSITIPGMGSTLPGLGSNPPPGPPVMHAHIVPLHAAGGAACGQSGAAPQDPGEPQGYGEQEGVSVAVGALTHTILNEVREYTKMCLAVRERMLMPGLTEWQLEVERQTAAELESHLIDLRALLAKAFLG